MTAVSSRNLSKSVFQYIRVYTCVGSSFLGFIVVCVVCVECGVWCVSDWVWCVVLISAELNLNMAEYHYNLHKKCRCSKSWLPRHNLIHPYIHTYIHVHTRTYVHTYLHTYTCIQCSPNVCRNGLRSWAQKTNVSFHVGSRVEKLTSVLQTLASVPPR